MIIPWVEILIALGVLYVSVLFGVNCLSSNFRVGGFGPLSLSRVAITRSGVSLQCRSAWVSIHWRSIIKRVNSRTSFFTLKLDRLCVKLTESTKKRASSPNKRDPKAKAIALIRKCLRFKRILLPVHIELSSVTVETGDGVKICLGELSVLLELPDDTHPKLTLSLKDLSVGGVDVLDEFTTTIQADCADLEAIKDSKIDFFVAGMRLKVAELLALKPTKPKPSKAKEASSFKLRPLLDLIVRSVCTVSFRMNDCAIVLPNQVFAVQSLYTVGRGMGADNPVSTKLSGSSLSVFERRGKSEVLTSVTSLKISGNNTQCTMYVPFFSMLNYVDSFLIADFFDKTSNEFDDSFIRTIVTFNNPTFAWNLSSMLNMAKHSAASTPNTSPAKSPSMESLFMFLENCKLRVYFLNADLRIKMSDVLTLSFTSTEISLDLGEYQESETPLAQYTIKSTPEIELALKTRHISIAYYLGTKTRQSLFSIDNASSTAILLFPKAAEELIQVQNHYTEINDIECLLDDVDLFYSVAEISKAITIYKGVPVANENAAKSNVLTVLRSTLALKRAKFVSAFENPCRFYDNVDYSELNAYSRGFELAFEELDVGYKKDTPVEIALKSLIANLVLNLKTRSLGEQPVLQCTEATARICPKLSELTVVLPVVEVNIDIETVWTVLFVKAIISSVLPKAKVKDAGEAPLKREKRAIPWRLELGTLAAHWRLPYEEQLLLELDSLLVEPCSLPRGIDASFKVFRVYVPSTQVRKGWSALLEIANVKTFLALDHDPGQELATIDASIINITLPFEYLLYKSLDNVVSFFKSSKQAAVNFADLMSLGRDTKDYCMNKIMPHAVEPIKMPKVKITANAFNFLFQDDAFEVKLNRIYQLGIVEQVARIRKMRKFEEGEEAAYKEVEARYLERKNNASGKNGPSPLRVGSGPGGHHRVKSFKSAVLGKTTSTVSLPVVQDEHTVYQKELDQTREKLDKVKRKLFANISRSWITRFDAAEEEMAQAFRRSEEQNQGAKVPVSAEILRKFKIFEHDGGFPLFMVRMTKLELMIDEPHSFKLEHYPKFLYEKGGGMPRDMKYSILIPLYLDIKCSSLNVRVKDYPLPMLSFVQSPDKPKVNICGDIVIAEQINVIEELRWVFVPLVSQYDDPEKRESLYSLYVPRTLTAVKAYMDLHVKVDSDIASSISWSESYQPGLGYAMSAFDVLSKPPLDPSPKIGFWDKFRLNMHGRFNFDFTGDLNLFIKSSSCPYDLAGTSAGFVFSWMDGVNLKLNYFPNPEDFLVVKSTKFEIGVPNFSSLQREYWLLSNMDGCGINFTLHKKLMKLSANPVVWKLGFLFERDTELDAYVTPGSVPRTSELKPHYEVRLRNPSTFSSEEEMAAWDSYRGFKSRYIHMSITVLSEGDQAYNSLHLSPMLFSHFFSWWNSFSLISLPIKEGKLFRNPLLDYRKKPKFGKSMFTIKYRLSLKPLFLSHMYRHSSSDDFKTDNKVAFTGLKCAIKSFTMDLHQRKQELRLVKEKLGVCTTDWHLKLNQGEVDFEEADLRLLTAVFNEKAVQGYLAKAFGLDSSSAQSQSNDSSTRTEFSTNKSVWWDPDDFIEIEQPDLVSENPKWDLIPFASSPRVSYFRQAPTSDMQYPFGEEWSHECYIGKNHPERTQEVLAKARQREIEKEIGTIETSLDSLHSSGIRDDGTKNRISSLNDQLDKLKHSLHVIRSILDDLAEGILPEADEFSYDSETSELGKMHTNGSLSLHSTDSNRGRPRISRTESARESFMSMRETSIGHSSPFWNRFIVHNMLLSWNYELTGKLLSYIYKVSERKSLTFYLTRNAVKLAEELMRLASGHAEKSRKSGLDYQFHSPKESVEDFDDNMEDNDFLNSKVFDTYLVKLISPQIRLISKSDVQNCLLLASRDVTLKVVTIYSDYNQLEDTLVDNNSADLSTLIQTRYGLLLNDALFYVINKSKLMNREYGFFHFDEEQNWPPSLPVEMCYDGSALEKALCIEKQSFGMIYYKPNSLYLNEELTKSLQVFFPKLAIIMNREQYQVIYNIANDLLEFSDPEVKKKTNRLEKLIAASDTNDLSAMASKVQRLQDDIRVLRRIKLLMKMLDTGVTKNYTEDLLVLEIELEKLVLELTVTMQILQKAKSLKDSDHSEVSKTSIAFDQIILHLLDENNGPFVDIAIAKAYFAKLASPDASSINQVCISLMQAFDLHGGCKYPEILAPRSVELVNGISDAAPMLLMEWTNLPPVGGIGVIDRSYIGLQPIVLEIDHHTAKKIALFFQLSDDTGARSTDSEVSSLFSDSDQDSADSSMLSPVTSLASSLGSSTHSKSVSKPVSKLRKSLSSIVRKNTSSEASLAEEVVSFTEDAQRPSANGVSQMVERSSKYKLWNHIEIAETTIRISFKGQGALSIVNVERLPLHIDQMTYTNKMWSKEELFMHLRKEVLRNVLKHTGKFIGNKLTKHRTVRTNQALPQIKDYQTYTKFNEIDAANDEDRHTVVKHGHVHKSHHMNSKNLDPSLLEPRQLHHHHPVQNVDMNTVFESVEDVEED